MPDERSLSMEKGMRIEAYRSGEQPYNRFPVSFFSEIGNGYDVCHAEHGQNDARRFFCAERDGHVGNGKGGNALYPRF